MKGRNLEKGITLIALIITIIVLLILAGVTLNIVLNTNLLDKSESAVDRYKLEDYKERIEVIKTSKYIEKTLDRLPNSLKDLVVENLREENWTKEVWTNEDNADLEENEIEVFTTDGYIIIAEILDDGSIKYKPIVKDGEPYPKISLSKEEQINDKTPVKVIVTIEKGKVSTVENVTTGEIKEYEDGGVIFELEENGEYIFKATSEAGKSSSKKIEIGDIAYTLSYDTNGGAETIESQTEIKGNPITISNIEPTKENHTFLGWAESATPTEVKYHKGDTYNKNKSDTLVAVWQLNNQAPVIGIASVIDRGTDYITFTANATDADGDELTYKVYLKEEGGSYSTTPNGTSVATASGANATISVTTGLTSYTIYDYKVEVTDGKDTREFAESVTGTGCAGTGTTCTGPFTTSTTATHSTASQCSDGGSKTCSAATYVSVPCTGSFSWTGLSSAPSESRCPNCGVSCVWSSSLSCYKCGATGNNYWRHATTCPSYRPGGETHKDLGYYNCSSHSYQGSSATHSYTATCSHGYTSNHYYCDSHGYRGTSQSHTYSTTTSRACSHGKYSQHQYCSHNQTTLHFPN